MRYCLEKQSAHLPPVSPAAHRGEMRFCRLGNPNKIFGKIFYKKPKFFLTYVQRPVIIHKRLCEARVYYAMKREIARGTEVTSVEYVRYR